MENNETTFDMKSKLEEMFENKLQHMEEKFVNDYEVLRGYSIEYTEAYHNFNENIYPIVLDFLNTKKTTQSMDLSQSISQTPAKRGADRSRTPVRAVKPPVGKKEDVPDRNAQTQKIAANGGRSKTPVMTKEKPIKKDLKKDTENPTTKSTNLLPTVKHVKVDQKMKTIEAKSEKPEKFVKKENHSKTIPKRDMTPTPVSKKNALDISHDDHKGHEINIKNYNTKKASIKEVPKDDRLYHTNKRPTVTGLSGSLSNNSSTIKEGSEFTSKTPLSKRNSTGADKKLIPESVKIIKSEKTPEAEDNLNNGGSQKKETKGETKQEQGEDEKIEKISEFNKTVIVDLATRKPKLLSFTNKNVECLFIASNSK